MMACDTFSKTPMHPHNFRFTARKHPAEKIGSSVALSRPYTLRKHSSSQEDEHNSQEDCDSAYSCMFTSSALI